LFKPELGSFSSWFWQLARNTLIDHYRSSENKRVNNFSEFQEETLEDISTDESSRLESKIELDKVFQFLETLSQEEQEFFELRFIAQLSFREISHVTGKSEGSLRIYSMRLKKKIKDELKGK